MKFRQGCIIIGIILVGIVLSPLITYRQSNSGEPSNAAKEAQDTPKKAPLPVKLLGTIVESNPAQSAAVISDLHTQKQTIYKLGDKLFNYQIIKIVRGKIFLLSKNKVYFIELPLGSESEPLVAIAPNKIIVNRSALTEKIPDLNTALQQAIPIPHIEAGKIIGLKITNIKDKKLAKLAGIKEGDVVTSVNGENLNSIKNALEIYYKVREQDRINVELKRGNKKNAITYYIN